MTFSHSPAFQRAANWGSRFIPSLQLHLHRPELIQATPGCEEGWEYPPFSGHSMPENKTKHKPTQSFVAKEEGETGFWEATSSISSLPQSLLSSQETDYYKTEIRLSHSPAQNLPMAFHHNQKKVHSLRSVLQSLHDLAPNYSLNLFPILLSALATPPSCCSSEILSTAPVSSLLHKPVPTTSGFLNINTTDIWGQRHHCCGGLSYAGSWVVSSIPGLYL